MSPAMLGLCGRRFWVHALLLAATFWFFPARAQAYPWLIRHHYPACVSCHVDPSGGGLPTAYGYIVGDSVLPTITGKEDATPPADAAKDTINWLQIGGDYRAMWLRSKAPQAPLTERLIWMQADLEAAVNANGFVASGSLGYAYEGALGAAITRRVDQNLVSRYHWLGYTFERAGVLLRAGRMNLPFGIRTIEHNLWARALTRTTINDDQQYGLSVNYSGDTLRGELMAIGGNLQLRPDRYRERGYSGYLEWSAADGVNVGASSLITHRDLDQTSLKETWRQAHGVFGRWLTGWQPLVLQTEWDYTLVSSKGDRQRKGVVSFLQADLEPWQGIHFLATGEANNVGTAGNGFWSYSGWLSYWWFVAPHADVRLDGIAQSLGTTDHRFTSYTLLLQGHLYL